MKNSIIINNNISQRFYKKKQLKKNFKLASRTLSEIEKKIDSTNSIYNLFSKEQTFNHNLKDLKKYRKFKFVTIIGMGGSILGSKAIYYFLKHKIKKDFLFLDNLDAGKIDEFFKRKIEKKTLFIIISKSGNTLETLVNISFFKKKLLNHKNTIIITEQNKGQLNNLSNKMGIRMVEHKKHIGGRYSVLSEVGMLPSYFMGLNISKFKKNLSIHFGKKNKNLLCKSASKLSQNYLSKKIRSIVFFNYCPELNNAIYWCQQLLGESLGKKGKGILPILSPAPKDHHSLLQLYLDGPRDKIFYIISAKSIYKKKIGEKINKTVLSQRNAFIKVLKRKKIPYREFHFKSISEESITEFFSYFMLETIIISKLINVNPFDQPSVEEVKILTKKKII